MDRQLFTPVVFGNGIKMGSGIGTLVLQLNAQQASTRSGNTEKGFGNMNALIIAFNVLGWTGITIGNPAGSMIAFVMVFFVVYARGRFRQQDLAWLQDYRRARTLTRIEAELDRYQTEAARTVF